MSRLKNLNSQRILISLPKNFLEKLDELAEKENRTRSEAIREAIRQYIKNNESLETVVKGLIVNNPCK